MSSPHTPPPPGPDVPTRPHPAPLPDDPLKGPAAPPDVEQPLPTTPENPALPRPVHPPGREPAPTEPPTWG
jgi:hypothetical protein